MDYQNLCWLQALLLAAISVIIPQSTEGIVGQRDLLLTPKQGLQIKGKSIYYEEEEDNNITAIKTTTTRGERGGENNQTTTTRPWERTLKHVTYVTLFTNAAADLANGNISQLRSYTDFLQSPYIIRSSEQNSRFGDIITLASGRLEQINHNNNNSFHFIEGPCDYGAACNHTLVRALWQVQQIRHRDKNRKFRYEMKFSVSPLNNAEAAANGNSKRKAEFYPEPLPSRHKTLSQSFIQRDDDYPHSFGRIGAYADAGSRFAERRFDNTYNAGYQRQVTPMPQPTFLQGIFQPPPSHFHPPLPEKLNIGEYIKDFGTPKIEHFPSVIMNSGISRSHYPMATTFRPPHHYQQMKLPRPEYYQPSFGVAVPQANHERVKFPDHSREQFGTGSERVQPPVVTHHFHHHFYMPTSSSAENALASGEDDQGNSKNEVSPSVTPVPYGGNYYFQGVQVVEPPQIYKQKVVQVTPIPPLKKPQIYEMYPLRVAGKVPLLIYPAPVEEETAHEQPPKAPNYQTRNNKKSKPFRHSEPLAVEPIRYSEPDPLYLNLVHNPSTRGYQQVEESSKTAAATYASPKQPDSIAAQLPPPDHDQDVRIPYEDDEEIQEESKSKTKHEDSAQNYSQKQLRISNQTTTTEKDTENYEPMATTVAPSTTPSPTSSTKIQPLTPKTSKEHRQSSSAISAHIQSTLTPTTHTLQSTSSRVSPTRAIESSDQSTKSPQKHQQFVSTSTAANPLRALSRYRVKFARPGSNSNNSTATTSTTTTEVPVLKWRPRRKQKLLETKKTPCEESNKANKTADDDSPFVPSTNEVIEVLTQKSVSKSVSIKVGHNGEEIPIIVEDDGNEKHAEGEVLKLKNEEPKQAENEVKTNV